MIKNYKGFLYTNLLIAWGFFCLLFRVTYFELEVQRA